MNKKILVKRILIAAAFAAIAAIFVLYFIFIYSDNGEAPVFSLEVSDNVFSVKATQEDFLKGVEADDAEDGSVTDSILIEGISEFTPERTRIITYAAFDSDNNVTKFEREISYSDYTPPVITSNGITVFPIGTRTADFLAQFEATDSVDGDISESISIQNDSFKTNVKGVQQVTLGVMNSCGDITIQTFEIEVIN